MLHHRKVCLAAEALGSCKVVQFDIPLIYEVHISNVKDWFPVTFSFIFCCTSGVNVLEVLSVTNRSSHSSALSFINCKIVFRLKVVSQELLTTFIVIYHAGISLKMNTEVKCGIFVEKNHARMQNFV